MAFVFDPSLAFIDMARVGLNIPIRTEKLGKIVAKDIEIAKQHYPEHSMLIDLDKYRDGAREWEKVRKNVIAGLEKIFRTKIMAKQDARDDTEWEPVKEGDGCDSRYLVVEFTIKDK